MQKGQVERPTTTILGTRLDKRMVCREWGGHSQAVQQAGRLHKALENKALNKETDRTGFA